MASKNFILYCSTTKKNLTGVICMKRTNRLFLFFNTLIVVFQIGCAHYPALQEPDLQTFKQTVHSESILDSLNQGKLAAGMPHFVVSQLFENYSAESIEIKVPVATLGANSGLKKKKVGAENMWIRISIFFLTGTKPLMENFTFGTKVPDFYRMDVSARDTLCVFFEDTVYCSVINYLNKSSVLTVRDSLPQIPVHTSLYAEIRYNDHPWRQVSYWYGIENT